MRPSTGPLAHLDQVLPTMDIQVVFCVWDLRTAVVDSGLDIRSTEFEGVWRSGVIGCRMIWGAWIRDRMKGHQRKSNDEYRVV